MKTPIPTSVWPAVIWLASVTAVPAQVVNVTASLDKSNILAGESTILRVFAQVIPAQQTNADRIFSWYVDVLNTTGTVATANYDAMQKTASDNDPSTSSTGTQDGVNRRAIYDTFLNLAGAGVSAPVELMAIPVSGSAPGRTGFRVQAGTGAGLSWDFLVAPKAGGAPLTGGNYLSAEAVLTVNPGPPPFRVSLLVTNAAGNSRGVTLRFPTTAGFNYTAQHRDQVVGGSGWQPLPGAPHNTGTAFELTTARSRFYRVAVTSAN